MQLRVVTDQPWAVQADVLVIPVFDELAFEGPLGELDRRSGGELRALSEFRELQTKRYATALAASGELPAGRLFMVGGGEAAQLERETVVRIAASAERRLGGRQVASLAVWLSPLADALEGGVEAVADLVARGIVEGTYDPHEIYRQNVETAPPRSTS